MWETIKKCQVGNVDGAVMAVDMAKAFDTLSNKFLDSVLKLKFTALFVGHSSVRG